MKALATALMVVALAAPAIGSAEVTEKSASSFLLSQRVIVKSAATASYQALLHPERWWKEGHTWSGSAKNISLDPHAGGCWCERWADGEVEHARVVFMKKNELLRLQGSFGPMQGLAVTGVLEFQLTQGKDGTQVDMSYRVNGSEASKLDMIAPMADGMFAEQMASLKSLLDAEGEAARK
jgi:uncharacterized protein YndB with AHSA1/START domain